MTNTTNTPEAGDNIKTGRNELRNKLKSLGEADGKGSASRPEAGLRLVGAAYDGLIDENDAGEMFASYVSGIAKASANNPLISGTSGDVEQKSSKQQISKFRQLIKAGSLPSVDSRDVMARTVQIVSSYDSTDTKTLSRFDAMLASARAQIAQPDVPLTDEQINGLVVKADTPEKTDLDKLVDEYKRLHKLAEAIPLPQTQAAVDAYRDAITEAGGDVPPMTKEEKAEAEVVAFMAKRGMVAVHAIAAQ